MAGYTKLFNSILASTIWRADDKTRIVWITLLAMADKNGVAEGSVPGLADFARVSIEDCRVALRHLMSPDDESRSKESNGRRIKAVDGGWRLVNHRKYRDKMSKDERRQYLNAKQREYRREQKNTPVDSRRGRNTKNTHTEAAPAPEADKNQNIRPAPRVRATEPPDPNVKAFLTWFQSEYKTRRHGADYLIRWEKDAPTVKRLLQTTSLERLKQCTQVMLSDKCEDDFVIDSDRGVGVLSARFNWLSERLAVWEAKHPR